MNVRMLLVLMTTARRRQKRENKTIVDRLFNAKQTNAHTFHFLGGTDMEQKFRNPSCFGNHNTIKVFAIIAPVS